jgi:hypothetical protein
MSYPTISFEKTKEFETKLLEFYKEYGVVVITNVFTPEYCSEAMDSIISDICSLTSHVTMENLENTWERDYLPPQTRPGLFQSLCSNFSKVWEIRSNEHVKFLFTTLYEALRGRQLFEFIVSSDGINIKPGFKEPVGKVKDWAHLDQGKGNIFSCIQGQAVLTTSSASFVATPKSHLYFSKILKLAGVTDGKLNDFVKFKPAQVKLIKEYLEQKEIPYQVPIEAPKGSFIVWSSSLIHSARLQTCFEYPTLEDKWNGWRGIVYVCYRPRTELTNKEITLRKKRVPDNRVTPHWSIGMFPVRPGGRWSDTQKPYSQEIEVLLKDPKLVYEKIKKVELTKDQRKLAGLL